MSTSTEVLIDARQEFKAQLLGRIDWFRINGLICTSIAERAEAGGEPRLADTLHDVAWRMKRAELELRRFVRSNQETF